MSLNVSNEPVIVKKDEALKSDPNESEPIPNVQEMVKLDPTCVPPEYIRAQPVDEDTLHHLTPLVPVIDLSVLQNGSTEELSKLEMACKEWGFFQLVNHGVEEQLLQAMKDGTAHFLEEPLNEKNKYAMPEENMEGYGHIEVDAEDKKRDWSDSLLLVTRPIKDIDLSFWPKTPERYRELTDIYSNKLYQVGVELLSYLSLILGMEKDALLKLHKGPGVYFNVNYYPPCYKPDHVLAMDIHSDDDTINMVMQDQDVTALQIKYKEGWVPVVAIPNSLICNIGEFIEIWSNGRYKSAEHKVVTNKTEVRSVHEVFLLPEKDVQVEPLNNFISPQNPKLYQKIRVGDYAHVYTNSEKQGRSKIESIMIK